MISAAVLSLTLSADVAVRNRFENQQRQRALETEALWQATVQVAFGGSFEDLLRGCLERICRVTGWPAGHVYLPDTVNDPRRLLPSRIWYFEREELAPLAHETAGNVLTFGEELTCKVCATRKSKSLPKNSNGANQPGQPILLKPRKQILRHGLCAAFGFPLYAEGKLQAVLEFFSTTQSTARPASSLCGAKHWRAAWAGSRAPTGPRATTPGGGDFRFSQSHDYPLGGVRGNTECAQLCRLSH